jgi:hypothetical protein
MRTAAPRLPEQVSHQPDVQEAGRSLHRYRLLQDEAGSDQQRRKQGGDVVEAEADVHNSSANLPPGRLRRSGILSATMNGYVVYDLSSLQLIHSWLGPLRG